MSRLEEAPKSTFTITSTRDGRKARFESRESGLSHPRAHKLKGIFMQEFKVGATVAGYVGSTNLIVDEIEVRPDSDKMIRARYGGELTIRKTKGGVVYEMSGGQTVYGAIGETKDLGDESISVTLNNPTETTII